MKLQEFVSHIDTPYHYIIILFMTSISSLIIGIFEPDTLLKFVGVAVFFLTMVLVVGYSNHEKRNNREIKHD